MANDVRIAITGNTADAEAALRRLRAEASRTDGLEKLRGALIGLSPAIVPIAAQLAPIAAGAAAAGVATVAFTAAVIPQAKAMGEAAKAQDKATEALQKYGAGSKQAEAAQRAALDAMSKLPPATRNAAEAFILAKKSFTDWSNSLSKFTAPVVEHALGVGIALLPKMNGLVKGSSQEFDRLLHIIGGTVESPGFDKLDARFTKFADRTLARMNSGLVHLIATVQSGRADGPLSKFVGYVDRTGPQVEATLKDLGVAVAHIGEAAANAGPGMLTIVDALAKMVGAIPPELLTRLVQLYTAFKVVGLSSALVATASVRVATLGRSLNQMRTAAAAATGTTASLTAAYGTLSTGARLGITTALVGGLYLGLKHYVDAGGKAKVTTDQWGSSLKALDTGGKGASQAISDISRDLKNINYDAGGKVVKDDSILGILLGSHKKSSADKDLKNLGKALADLVKSGDSDLAAAALRKLNAEGKKVPTKYLKDYKQALADADVEAKLTADSMGIFGAQSLEVSRALDKQSRAAQGLHDAIFALNDVNRGALDAEADFQQALDDGTAALKNHKNALHYLNGELDLNSDAARTVYRAMSQIASTSEAAAEASVKQTGTYDKANRILAQTHDALVNMGRAAGLSTADANRLADSLDNIKDPKIRITAQSDQAKATIADATKRLNALAKKKATPKITAEATQLKNVINDARARLDKLNGKTVQTHIVTTYSVVNGKPANMAHEGGGYYKGGPVGAGRAAVGGPRSNLTWVGEQGPELVDLAPGSMVHPAANSRQMGGTAGGPLVVQSEITVRSAGYAGPLEELLLRILREAVANRGGNVQNVLGNGGF